MRLKTRKRRTGGMLVGSPLDLKNGHICNQRTPDYRTSPAFEVYTSIDEPFCLSEATVGYFLTKYKKSDDHWFKFVLFSASNQPASNQPASNQPASNQRIGSDDHSEYIYIIRGAPINKHSVPMLFGLLEQSDDSEYVELRNAYRQVVQLKGMDDILAKETIETHPLIIALNQAIYQAIPCMPVLSAGSGTVVQYNNQTDGRDSVNICINAKSGHYKPKEVHMNHARRVFSSIIPNSHVDIRPVASKEELAHIYGENRAETMNGMCI